MRDWLMSWASALALTLTTGVTFAQDRAAQTAAGNTSGPSASATPGSAGQASAGSPTAAPKTTKPRTAKPAASAPLEAKRAAAEPAAPSAPSQAGSPPQSEEVALSATRQTEGESDAEPAPKKAVLAPKKAGTRTRSAVPDSKGGARKKSATAPPRGRFVLGLRAGWGIPLGEAQSGSDLSATATGEVPIWLDVGYRVLPSLMLGAYGQYAFPFVGQCADAADSCTLHAARFGLQAQYSLAPNETFDPWVGLGLGYEMLWGTAQGPTTSYDAKYSGFEFANLQVGADWSASQALAAGPFLSFSVGQFSAATFGATSGDIEKKALHEWLLLGVRGNYSL